MLNERLWLGIQLALITYKIVVYTNSFDVEAKVKIDLEAILNLKNTVSKYAYTFLYYQTHYTLYHGLQKGDCEG